MCRSIKVLRRPAVPVTQDEISTAALQFVRKVSGYHKPSLSNQAVFDAAVKEIAQATDRLLQSLAPTRPRSVVNESPREDAAGSQT